MSGNAIRLTDSEVEQLLEQNSAMRRLLTEHQWSGLTPLKSGGVCPECCGSTRHGGHRTGCALEAVLAAPDLT
jgi:hypothetical protein